MKNRLILALSLLICLTSSLAQAQEDDKKDKKKTHTVKTGFFEVVEEVNAVVESQAMTEITANMEQWTALEIEKILDEGSTVEKDTELVWFKIDDIDRKLGQSTLAVKLAEVELKNSELNLRLFDKTANLDADLEDQRRIIAEEDLRYFIETERPNREKGARRSVENSQHALEYAQEEFNQLKRMYTEDELTEESEEIVLKRTERDVENRQYYLEQAQIRTARELNMELPRETREKELNTQLTILKNERDKAARPLTRSQKKMAFEKATIEFQNQATDFRELETDRKSMVVTAPASGMLYFGRCVRGKWTGQSSPNRELQKGKSVTPNKVFATIVDPTSLKLRADLSEKQLAKIQVGSEGVATPTAFPNAKVAAKVDKVSYVPVAEDKFDCQLSLTQIPKGLMPGMTCKLRFLIRRNTEALTVPASAVFTDDGISHYVFVEVEGADAQRRTVTKGLTADKKTEIMDGLKENDVVLTERPE